MFMYVSNGLVQEVTVIRQEGDMCIVQIKDTRGGIRVRSSRLMAERPKEKESPPQKQTPCTVKQILGPYAYRH